jgi:hypothetical protein
MLYEYNFSDGKSVKFIGYSLCEESDTHLPKHIDVRLKSCLLDASEFEYLNKNTECDNQIFLGFSSESPDIYNKENGASRFPLWIPSEIISRHILIGGSIGSGKTSLTYRLLAGSLATFGSVIIGEAKGGLKGFSEGAAFTDLSAYLCKRLKVNHYRFPRGNCWFNPLFYLSSREERRSFMHMIAGSVDIGEGEFQSYVYRAADIATLILEIMCVIWHPDSRKKEVTFRSLVSYLKHPGSLQGIVEKWREAGWKSIIVDRCLADLHRLNFFALSTDQGREKFVMTATGVNFFLDVIDGEDLFKYTELSQSENGSQKMDLDELTVDDILYKRSLVVVSQPLNDPRSKILGPIFWDALLNAVLSLGPNPPQKNERNREKVAVFLDETHRLPVGNLGQSGDFLRQYDIGLVEITPAIVDKKRWEQNRHIYQTILSLSPGVTDILQLVHERLPNIPYQAYHVSPTFMRSDENRYKPTIEIKDLQNDVDLQDTPGFSIRSMRDTGCFTALLHSSQIRDASGLFWIDLESPLLEKFDFLVKEALDGEEAAAKIVDYCLGLTYEYTDE